MGCVIAIAVCVLGIVFNWFIGSWLQASFGLCGLAVTELGFALLALAGAAAVLTLEKRRSLRAAGGPEGAEFCHFHNLYDVFSVRRPVLRHVAGGLLLIAAAYLLMNQYSTVAARLFPAYFVRTSEGLGDFLSNDSLFVLLCGSAFIPAICEELLFRGFTQYALLRSLKPTAAVILTGALFGLFHVNPIRIPAMAMAGVALCYACYRSRSIFVPMIMHFGNNAVSAVLSSLPAADVSVSEQIQSLSMAGQSPAVVVGYALGVLISAAAALVLLGGGAALLEPDIRASLKKNRGQFAAVLALVLLLAVLQLATAFIPITV